MNAELPGRAFKIAPNEKHKTHLWHYIVGIIICISYLLPFYVLINMVATRHHRRFQPSLPAGRDQTGQLQIRSGRF